MSRRSPQDQNIMSAGERIVRLWVEAKQTGMLNKSKLALESALGRRIPPSWERVRTKVKLQGSIQAQATTSANR